MNTTIEAFDEVLSRMMKLQIARKRGTWPLRET